MKKIKLLLLLTIIAINTSCDKNSWVNDIMNVPTGPGIPYLTFVMLDDQRNYILEQDIYAVDDIEIIYNGKTFKNDKYNSKRPLYINSDTEASPITFDIEGEALWGNEKTTNFMIRFREHCWDISYTTSVNDESTREIFIMIDGELCNLTMFPVDESEHDYFVAYPLYLK